MKRLLLLLIPFMVVNIEARQSVKEFYNDHKKIVNNVGIGLGIVAFGGIIGVGYVFGPRIYDKVYLSHIFRKYKINCSKDDMDYPKVCSYITISRKAGFAALKNYVYVNNQTDDFKSLCNQTNLVKALSEINKVDSQNIVDIYLKKGGTV